MQCYLSIVCVCVGFAAASVSSEEGFGLAWNAVHGVVRGT